MQSDNKEHSTKTIKILGYAGLLPFVLLLLISAFSTGHFAQQAAESMLFYAAMILTFLGAVHWGYVLAADNCAAEKKRLYWAVTPSLIGWVALMLPAQLAIVLLMLAFALCWWIDTKLYVEDGLAWYMNMRTHLTVVVVASLGSLLIFG